MQHEYDPTFPEALAAPQRQLIGDVLIAEGTITEAQLDQALRERTISEGTRERIGEAIVRLGLATERDVARAVARQLGIPYVDDRALTIDPGVAAAVPPALAERHNIVPLRRDPDGSLVFAVADPTDTAAVDEVRQATGSSSVRAVVAPASAIARARDRAYGVDRRAGPRIEPLEPEAGGRGYDDSAGDLTVVEDAPIVQLAEAIINDAITAGASAIHVEPGDGDTAVRYRIDGVLQGATTVPKRAAGAVLARLKLIAAMDIAEHRLPQVGRARVRGPSGLVDLHVSTLPGLRGETLVARLLREQPRHLHLYELGLADWQLETALHAIEQPRGLVLVTGPAGSGKTSTLYAFLSHYAGEKRNIITLEDQIKYQLDGVNQAQTNPRTGFTLAAALRTALHQDPDIVMVDELGDQAAAELAVRASRTRHIVLSALHASDAAEGVFRLSELGIPSELIANAVTMVLAQRLVRKICPHCTGPAQPAGAQAARLRLSNRDLRQGEFRTGAGCDNCNDTGYAGRVGVYELLLTTDGVREALLSGGGESAIRHAARRDGMENLRLDALAKAKQGVTTVDEVLRVTPANVRDQADARTPGPWACPSCEHVIDPGFDYCPWCTADLRSDRCRHCGCKLHFGWEACPRCGSRLE